MGWLGWLVGLGGALGIVLVAYFAGKLAPIWSAVMNTVQAIASWVRNAPRWIQVGLFLVLLSPFFLVMMIMMSGGKVCSSGSGVMRIYNVGGVSGYLLSAVPDGPIFGKDQAVVTGSAEGDSLPVIQKILVNMAGILVGTQNIVSANAGNAWGTVIATKIGLDTYSSASEVNSIILTPGSSCDEYGNGLMHLFCLSDLQGPGSHSIPGADCDASIPANNTVIAVPVKGPRLIVNHILMDPVPDPNFELNKPMGSQSEGDPKTVHICYRAPGYCYLKNSGCTFLLEKEIASWDYVVVVNKDENGNNDGTFGVKIQNFKYAALERALADCGQGTGRGAGDVKGVSETDLARSVVGGFDVRYCFQTGIIPATNRPTASSAMSRDYGQVFLNYEDLKAKYDVGGGTAVPEKTAGESLVSNARYAYLTSVNAPVWKANASDIMSYSCDSKAHLIPKAGGVPLTFSTFLFIIGLIFAVQVLRWAHLV